MQNEIKTAPAKEKCYVESICTRCDFYDGPDDDLECSAYKILKGLVEKKVISLKDIDETEIDCGKKDG